MKKIGLITFHDTANHGAALQLYATLKKISDFGFDVEAIDYSNEYRRSKYNVKNRLIREIKEKKIISAIKTSIASPLIVARMNAFNKFYKKHTPTSTVNYNNPTDVKNAENRYDAFVCGSDQIWSPKNNGGDTTFLLDFVKDSERKFSYASSFGSVDIPSNLLEDYKYLLLKMGSLSTREKTGSELIKNMCDRDATVVLDPVFLLTKDEWLKLIDYKSKPNNNLLDYTATQGMLDDFLSVPGLKENYLEIDKMGTSLKISDFFAKKINTQFIADPIDFIRNINDTKLLFTSSFHGTVLAIILKKPFVSVLSNDPGRDSRIIDLLSEFGLNDRIFHENMTIDDIQRPIDFDAVHSILEVRREQSLSYLSNALSKIENING